MTFTKSVTCFDFYDRAQKGEKCTQDDWDLMTIPMKAMELKQKYNLDFGTETVPTDKDQMERLFKAGFDMLLDCGIYCTDTKRIVKYTEDEIWDAINNPMPAFQLGTGRDSVQMKKREVGDKRKPIVQGGPTGSPISEDMFMPIHMSYALEKEVDTIVNGVMMTVRGKPPIPGSPYEILAAKSETRLIRNAASMAGRPGMAV
ncbi:methylamine--corrinoid protein Co-methyltransferase [Methanococcoides alaskense]|uniref:[methylamine--corrinoid protein] Co-methyltransferase n=1 Tax=Methanococcoides alaskense TaxID=325778 RepID=A0AA90Z9H9_9EURY|nr:methylamine--corrinoid protein Co-methyltransferase [Methanococcoides alaskense]